jgi:hypothetical protein
LNDGGSWEDAKALFGMKASHVVELLGRVWKDGRPAPVAE